MQEVGHFVESTDTNKYSRVQTHTHTSRARPARMGIGLLVPRKSSMRVSVRDPPIRLFLVRYPVSLAYDGVAMLVEMARQLEL